MTYEAFETSQQSGRPVELYEFRYDNQVLRYTSGDTEVFVAGNRYQPAQLSRSQVVQTSDLTQSDLTIECDRDFPPAAIFEPVPPSSVVQLKIRRFHRDDLVKGVTLWQGRVTDVEFSGGAAKLKCESFYTKLQRIGLRRPYSKTCPYSLYGRGCNLSEASFQTSHTVVSADGASVSVGSLSGSQYAGGKFLLEFAPGRFARRAILAHSGGDIQLSYGVPELLPGQTVLLSPGCDRTMAVCDSVFSNSDNFGGSPDIVTKNPFDSSASIF
jgi:uncharacterized phage protein (TIGR02218 family)